MYTYYRTVPTFCCVNRTKLSVILQSTYFLLEFLSFNKHNGTHLLAERCKNCIFAIMNNFPLLIQVFSKFKYLHFLVFFRISIMSRMLKKIIQLFTKKPTKVSSILFCP